MNIWMIIPHRHKPGKTWFDVAILKSVCKKCRRIIIRKHTGRWVRLDKNQVYVYLSGENIMDRYNKKNSRGGKE